MALPRPARPAEYSLLLFAGAALRVRLGSVGAATGRVATRRSTARPCGQRGARLALGGALLAPRRLRRHRRCGSTWCSTCSSVSSRRCCGASHDRCWCSPRCSTRRAATSVEPCLGRSVQRTLHLQRHRPAWESPPCRSTSSCGGAGTSRRRSTWPCATTRSTPSSTPASSWQVWRCSGAASTCAGSDRGGLAILYLFGAAVGTGMVGALLTIDPDPRLRDDARRSAPLGPDPPQRPAARWGDHVGRRRRDLPRRRHRAGVRWLSLGPTRDRGRPSASRTARTLSDLL